MQLPRSHRPRAAPKRRVADAINSVIGHGRGSNLELANRGEMLRKLEEAGYNPDSVLLPNEIRSLARNYRADEYVTGRVVAGSGTGSAER